MFSEAATALAARNGQTSVSLTPGQQQTLKLLEAVASATPLVVLEGDVGLGKTTVLKRLQSSLSARYIGLAEMLDSIAARHPHSIEESIRGLMEDAFRDDKIVILDDFDCVATVTKMSAGYPRPFLMEAVVKAIFADACARGQKLVIGQRNAARSYEIVSAQPIRVALPSFVPEDYAAIFARHFAPDVVDRLDVHKIFRHASRLQGYQLAAVSRLLCCKTKNAPSTEDVIGCMNEHILMSNTRVTEVEPVSFRDLKGAEALIELLEANILLPMQDTERAEKLGLRPKRGVLLYGQPGTGKTSIGRALAHQMKGKFFIIDGTFVTEPPNVFFNRIRQVFEDAKANSPAVIFIDDADVLFRTDQVHGLNRYLLTMLDGLESETIGNVCVMLTAMNVADLPPALLRSGRVELCLETELPDLKTRQEILGHYLRDLPEEYQTLEMPRLLAVTNGFTPADLRRVVSDAKVLLIFDQAKQREPKDFGAYALHAAEQLRGLKEKLAPVLGYKLPKIGDPDAVSGS